MPREIVITNELKLAGVMGLVAPTRRRQRHLMDWTVDGVRRPPYFRWSWHPARGDLLVGTPPRHVAQIRAQCPDTPFEAWLRGFVFYPGRAAAIRTYWWPQSAYEDFDPVANRQVTGAFTRLLRPILKNYRFHAGVDNAYLAAHFSSYASSW